MTGGIYFIALAVLASLSLLGIYRPEFRDNLLQRLGLCGVCFGAVLGIFTLAIGRDLEGPRYILTCGAALFAIGVTWKFWRAAQKETE